MKTPSNLNLMLGAGQLWFNRTDADTGYAHLGNCTSFELSFDDTIQKVINRMTNALGTYRRITSERVANVSVTGQEFNPDNVALVTMGDVAALAQGAASASGEVLATAAQAVGERAYQTEFRNISAVVIKQGATTLTLDDDYTIEDATLGLITFHTDGTDFVAGTQIDIDYSYAAATNPTVRGGSKTNIEGALIFIGDPAAGPAMDVKVHIFSVEPEGALEFIGDNFLDWTLAGEALDDSVNHPNAPFWEAVDRLDYR
jgi:hypothetical protein